ncbi:homeobox protein knotted-1-like 3 isoform X2 [Actinidia eriantha]|uniref:homeobox protein knotted-1-like 3 isoform X2 n=1 Tax=Actinidia eriantha TaxID=165200 RepID=UPI002584469D|nr:homeobox protein knotted-1-like 3 isoform X2 [Actinidia eriantha]XP_057488214.1 homeobox protein knotted-1-like 3 isoform X2 [Actinidia eriantha]
MAFPNHSSQEMSLQHFSDQHLGENTSVMRTILPQQLGQPSPEMAGKAPENHHRSPPRQVGVGPTWLNSAILRQQSHYGGSSNFLHLHTNSDSPTSQASNPWLSRSILQRNVSDVRDDVQVSSDSVMAAAISHESADLNHDNRVVGGNRVENNGGVGGELTESDVAGGIGEGVMIWQNARYKSEILSHPFYEQLLSAHVACLRIATPVDQLPRIDAQLAQSQNVVAKYSAPGQGHIGDDKELDQFMTHYVLLLCSFKEQLQQHVRVHAMEAVMACWEIEQSLQSLTGVSPGEGTGATMSDDEEDQLDSDTNFFDGSLERNDSMNFGPLVPTESERSLMERVRQELKHELKGGYKEKIVDIREEILRKRRAGKLPGDTTSVLKAWWQSHSKWPYPTEEDKARLVQETGLQLKQINNWFINQRKRNWNSNPSTSTDVKSKRKR